MYYLAAHVPTVANIVEHGTLPSQMPNWLKIDKLLCAKTISACMAENKRAYDQVFVIAINIQDSDSSEVLLLNKIDPKLIKRIFVYSTIGFNLLKNLLKKDNAIEVIIEPYVYPEVDLATKKRPLEEEKKVVDVTSPVSSHKKIRADLSPAKPATIEFKKNLREGDVFIDRILTYEDHLHLLRLVFLNAKNSILITSFSINEETMEKAGLYDLIPRAKARHVKIYIYYNDQKELSNKIASFFKHHQVNFDYAYTHSKIIAVDRTLVAAGSCNWLSIVDSRYPESEEGSLVFQGDVCEDMIEDVWSHIKFYRNLQFDNGGAIYQFQKDPDNEATIIYELDDKTEVGYLPTLEQHGDFLQRCFEDAKKRVIVCSPFISTVGQYEYDIDQKLLHETVTRGVEIFFICSASSSSLDKFDAFLAKVNSAKIHLIPVQHIHLKTIIVDDNIIGDSSFNWLSASRDEESDFHNHEQTIFIQGPKAKGMIEKFFQSRVGLLIKSEAEKKTDHAGYHRVTSSASSSQNQSQAELLPFFATSGVAPLVSSIGNFIQRNIFGRK